MPTLSLPIQLAGTGTNPPPQCSNSASANGAAQFGLTLSREMAQQQQQQQHPALAPARPSTAQSAPASRPAQTQAQAQAQAQTQAKPADIEPATASTDVSADEAKNDEAKDKIASAAADAASAAANAAAGSPVAELLALVASFNPPAVALATSFTQASAAFAASAALSAQAAASAAALAAPALAVELAKAASATSVDPALAAAGKAPALKDALQVTPTPPAGSENLTALRGAAHQPGLDDAAGQVSSVMGSIDVVEQASAPAALRAEPASLAPVSPLPLRPRDSAAELAALKDVAPAAPVTAPLQQASLAMAPTLAASPLERITARVGTPSWDNQVGQKIIWMVAGKEQSASMTLNPPDMGPMQVVLSVTGDHATVTFSAAQPEVRQALENALPKLRDMLGESGIALGNASVNAGMPDQRQAQQGEPPRQQGSNARFGSAGEAARTAPAAPRMARPDGGAGLVDTFA